MSDKQAIAQHYHQRTKYDPQTIASKQRQLDWREQPLAYKTYKVGQTYDLTSYLQDSPQDPDEQHRQRLSRFLLYSYGVSAKLQTMTGEPLYLRTAPSAGGLYPAEVYLLVRGMSCLPPGLYNYHSPSHSLVHFWDDSVWPQLQEACFWHPALENTSMAIAISAVFFRSAWRYQDRAYRRIFLDTGHLLGNLELGGTLCDFRPHLIGGFNEEALNNLLYFDPKQEGVIAIAALANLLEIDQNLPPLSTTAASSTHTEYPQISDGELLSYFHKSTQIGSEPKAATAVETNLEDKYKFPFGLNISVNTQGIDWGENLEGLEKTILRRRSTRSYSGQALTLEELASLLHFTYQSEAYRDRRLDPNPDYFDLNLLSTFVAVSGVVGLEEGCYYYAPKSQQLRQIRFKNFRQELHYLCLGQDLGRDAAALVFHTADLETAIQRYGDRVYRYLHMDAGHLGQRLNLAAIYLGLGVSGIGGFFDDLVNEVLGIPSDEAVIYITTLGRPRTA